MTQDINRLPDIDIDLDSSFDAKRVFGDHCIPASRYDKNEHDVKNHPCGVYFQNIPKDQITECAAIPHDVAGKFGYRKFDFLHLYFYDSFNSRRELEQLIDVEPDWDLLLDESVVKKLSQISKHYDVVSKVKPRSVDDLSDVLALIRPGKKHLLEDYLLGKIDRNDLYRKEIGNQYHYKKSHAVGYAIVVKVQLVLLTHGVDIEAPRH